MHTHVHTHTHTHRYTNMHTHTLHTNIHTCIHTHIHTYTHSYMHTYIHTHIHTYIHTYIYLYVHTNIYINIYIYIYKRSFVFWDVLINFDPFLPVSISPYCGNPSPSHGGVSNSAPFTSFLHVAFSLYYWPLLLNTSGHKASLMRSIG